MTTPELLTKEEERVWLATYEASLAKDAGIRRSMDVAMEAVQEWRKVAAPGRRGSAEDELRGTLRDIVQTLRDEMAALETANGELRQDVADLRSKLAVVNDMHDKAVASQDRLLADLAQAWEALGSHGQPGRTLAGSIQALRNNWETTHANNAALRAEVVELVAALPPGEGTVVERVKLLVAGLEEAMEDFKRRGATLAEARRALGRFGVATRSLAEDVEFLRAEAERTEELRKTAETLRDRLATISKWTHQELSKRNGAASLHQGHWTACDAASCRADRAALGEDWLTAWDPAHSADA